MADAKRDSGLDVEVIVLDIEGTVCPISFVKDVLYPYSLSAFPPLLSTSWDSPTFAPYRSSFPSPHNASPSALLSHFRDLVSQDQKTSYLKNLQGYLWRKGYENGELKCELFSDVKGALERWNREGKKVVIYSSGSVEAQKLLFGFTTEGDLRGLISGWFDLNNAGPKRAKSSYEKIFQSDIAGEKGIDPVKWLFVSDIVQEVDAAIEAGWQAVVVCREGNGEIGEVDRRRLRCVGSFNELGG